MDVCLEILSNQIENIKKDFEALVIDCENMCEYSEYSNSAEHNVYNKPAVEQLNRKLKNLYTKLSDMIK